MSLISLLGAKTKVIATLGNPKESIDPKTGKVSPYGTYGDGIYLNDSATSKSPVDLKGIIRLFIASGADLIRINVANFKSDPVGARFLEIKRALLEAEREMRGDLGERRLGILADLGGPKIRFDEQFLLPTDELIVRFRTSPKKQTPKSPTPQSDETKVAARPSACEATVRLEDCICWEPEDKPIEVILDAVEARLGEMPRRTLLGFIGDRGRTLEIRDVIRPDALRCKVIHVATGLESVASKQGFAIRGIPKEIWAYTNKDKADLKALLDADYDPRGGKERVLTHVGISFCQKREDVRRMLDHMLRIVARKIGKDPVSKIGEALQAAPHVIGKIETELGFYNVMEILDFADGVMIARGDLALEMPTVELPETSKAIVKMANLRGKTVIMATQMLESMVHDVECTRPEAVDVFNAVADGVDACMLAKETSNGSRPGPAIEKMRDLARRGEDFRRSEKGDSHREEYFKEVRKTCEALRIRWNRDLLAEYLATPPNTPLPPRQYDLVAKLIRIGQKRVGEQDSTDRICFAACVVAESDVEAKQGGGSHAVPLEDKTALVVPTKSGRSARMLSRFRPKKWILAQPHDDYQARKLSLAWGVWVEGVIRVGDPPMKVDELMKKSLAIVFKKRTRISTVVFTAGNPVGEVGTTNLVWRQTRDGWEGTQGRAASKKRPVAKVATRVDRRL